MANRFELDVAENEDVVDREVVDIGNPEYVIVLDWHQTEEGSHMDIRLWWQRKPGDWLPTKKGMIVPGPKAGRLCTQMLDLITREWL